MTGWYYDRKELKNTPSALDGIDYETEMRYRKEGARFIIDMGSKMDLGYNTTATGVVYFHRFYMFHSLRQFPRYVTACCCLFLAGKVEETPKKCKDIIKTARSLLSDQKFATFGDDPKEEVMTLERILLQTIKFDLQVEHPYSYLLKYAKCLKGDKNKLQKMVQMAWTFVNDSLCTTLALQWEPEIIAVALMYLAGKLSQFEVVDWSGRSPKHLRWWDMFVEDVTMDLLEDICHQVLDLYSHPNATPAPDSPPMAPRPQQANHPSKKAINGQSTVAHAIEVVVGGKTVEHVPDVSSIKNTLTPIPPAILAPVVAATMGSMPSSHHLPDVPQHPYQTFTTGIPITHVGSSVYVGSKTSAPFPATMQGTAPPAAQNVYAPFVTHPLTYGTTTNHIQSVTQAQHAAMYYTQATLPPQPHSRPY